MTRTCLRLLGVLLLASLAGCGTGESPTRSIDFVPLTAIEIVSQNPQAAVGTSNRFTAIGHYGDPTTFQFTRDITDQVTWASSDATVLRINDTVGLKGFGEALTAGNTTVSATLGAISASLPFTVSGATITGLSIAAPASSTLYVGRTLQLQVTGTFDNSTSQDLTESVTWSSDASTIASVGDTVPGKGLVSALAVGSANITATFNGQSDTLALTVATAALDSIEVTPEWPLAALAVDTTMQLKATGHYSDGSTNDLTSQAAWDVSDQNLASIDTTAGTNGLLKGLQPGNVTVTATVIGVSGTLPVTITSATLSTLAIDETTPTVGVGLELPLHATGTFSDGTTQVLTRDVLWSSDNTGIATVSNNLGTEGTVKGIAVGTANITANSNAVPTTSGGAVTTNVSLTVQ